MDEAVPYDEVKANPYCFMATTPTGGHLSWFEYGGGRWFARTVRSITPITSEYNIDIIPDRRFLHSIRNRGGRS